MNESDVTKSTSISAAVKNEQPQLVGLRPVRLNYRLGQLTLFRLRLPLIVLEFDPGATCSCLTAIDLPELRGARGYLIKGLPVETNSDLDFNRGIWLSRVLRSYPRYLVDLTTSYETYRKKFSSDTRRKLNRKMRDFQTRSGGTVHWKEYLTRAELEEFLPLAWRISATTYQQILLDASLPNTAAIREYILAQADQGHIRGYILFLKQEPVSYLLLPIKGTRVVYAYLGYDPLLRDYSPGTVLQLLVIERLFADPNLKVLDFTGGRGQHKQMFATHCVSCADVLILRVGLLNYCAIKSHAVVEHISSSVGSQLARMGIKRHIVNVIQRFAGVKR